MSDDRVDLGALDPTADPAFEQRVDLIVARGMAARRVGSGADVVSILSEWTRPILAAAALILVAGVPLLSRQRPLSAPTPVSADGSAADVLGIPRPLMDLARSPQPPGIAQLSAALHVVGVTGTGP